MNFLESWFYVAFAAIESEILYESEHTRTIETIRTGNGNKIERKRT